MKAGYRLLLGECVDAVSLDYRDGEHFQVVCPVCHEPVFKGHLRNACGIFAEVKRT